MTGDQPGMPRPEFGRTTWEHYSIDMQIAGRVGVPAPTVHAVVIRLRLNRLDHLDRATGEPIRRNEKSRPGELVRMDSKKLGVIPNGGGWRIHGRGRTPGRWAGERANAAAPSPTADRTWRPRPSHPRDQRPRAERQATRSAREREHRLSLWHARSWRGTHSQGYS